MSYSPLWRRSGIAILTASALTGVYAIGAGPVAPQLISENQQCTSEQIAAAHQVREEARTLLTSLRTSDADHPAASGLASDISAIGITPAVETGWKQTAVDTSDKLRTSTGPAERKVAIILAKHGLGPTPADLTREDSGPLDKIGEAGEEAAGTLGSAVSAASSAAQGKPSAPPPPPPKPQADDESELPPLSIACGAVDKQQEPDAESSTPQTQLSSPTSSPTDPAPAVEPAADPPSDDGSSGDSGSSSSGDLEDARAALDLINQMVGILRGSGDASAADLASTIEQEVQASPVARRSGESGGASSGESGGSLDQRIKQLSESAHEAADVDPAARAIAEKLDSSSLLTSSSDSSGSPGDPITRSGSEPETSSGSEPEANAAPAATTGSDPAVWDQLAECESSGNWAANTGNGYSGGLQFSDPTWSAFGGEGDAHQASKEEQIAVAERVQQEQGWGAWPACSSELGLS
ncbi:hypothetical protein Ae168Ps1_2709c [Pseudonocardia sp. Ae168_Ps1]|uniref:transglycosylase family protein n=1 Tax=unclassified Pseudonocardia TaxID=2619320 RepID=UPI000965E50D|nr:MULTISPECIES: transglycosylase family protein [unclassified Pseudonocardia]OLL74320.1 hypothetical protein Ae150APs1_2698c [Pseudonocardia sp. Ae150A_Ps1]OLL80303.1 hypothetical protein Ae168Ps1_2709c [Pseudonocardia sp. Ae168_Ps1]OLL85570.1 hypothetical protein Ae263Ps1_2625c [Pseudonocardia sp. Ae263_Ps1]OLL94400.1 hypothetical protein Ae356Ps1_4297c [Pseudonocardia sp. Ae356_Ps1]